MDLAWIVLVLCGAHGLPSRPQPTVYNRLTQEAQFQDFAGLVHFNRQARLALLQDRLTVFVPTGEAFGRYDKPLDSDLAWYHMAPGAWRLDDLRRARFLTSGGPNLPSLWVTATGAGLFINNAQLLPAQSDYVAKAHSHEQVLHVIDAVLEPGVRRPDAPQAAYDLLVSPQAWGLSCSTASFLYKVQEHQLAHLFQLEGGNTYFVPVDTGIGPKEFQGLDKSAIFGHLVPGKVLFTRPSARSLNHETMANGDDVYKVLSFEEAGGRLVVRQRSLAGLPSGATTALIVQADIPVSNGVVHLIAQPLGQRLAALKPFPHLPIVNKLGSDPDLDIVWQMGETTGFNQIFSTRNASFTYFVAHDRGWRGRRPDVELLKRHLVVAETPYSMERLLALSSARNYTELTLQSVGGPLRLTVRQMGGNFYVKWRGLYIRVLRPNYECTDGLLHVLAGPMAPSAV